MNQGQPDIKDLSRLIKVLIPILIAFVSFGVVFYHYVEKWSWFDSLWFTIVTIATIGYGDFVPHTVPGKVFTMLYVFVGIGLFIYVANTFLRYQALRSLRARKTRKEKYGKENN